MIRIQMIRGNTRDFDRRERQPSRASCEVGGRRYEATGPAPNYRLMTLLWLHGHGGAAYEVWDDVSPFGNPGGLAPEQRATAAKAAGVVVFMDADSRRTFAPGCATSPSDGPDHRPERERASTRVITAHTPSAA